MHAISIRQGLIYALVIVAALVAPYVLYPVFLMTLMCMALFACAFNLLFGYTGLLSFGHAAFIGWAGYVTGFVLAHLGWPTFVGLLIGPAVAALIGFVMGFLAIRRQGLYFTMITLALAEMLYFVALRASFTGGEDGLQGVPRGDLFGVLNLHNDVTLYYVVLAITGGGLALIWRTVHSPFGQVLKAIKENEPRAISLGYDVDRYKLLAFVLSAALSGLAGSTKTVIQGFVTLADVHWSMSGAVLLMTLVGGVGTMTGPIVGAVIIMWLDNRLSNIGNFLASVTSIEWFKQVGQSVTMVTGFIFIVCVLAFRGGIVGIIAARLSRRAKP
ncbi:MAG: branched-chain amino acid ABC transporter permease [Ramlibacter sp.]|nr:branched-chain amino acid ABC transporter permease [Ramlibacter sp.]